MVIVGFSASFLVGTVTIHGLVAPPYAWISSEESSFFVLTLSSVVSGWPDASLSVIRSCSGQRTVVVVPAVVALVVTVARVVVVVASAVAAVVVVGGVEVDAAVPAGVDSAAVVVPSAVVPTAVVVAAAVVVAERGKSRQSVKSFVGLRLHCTSARKSKQIKNAIWNVICMLQ